MFRNAALFICIFALCGAASAAEFASTNSGLWSASTTWSPNPVPTAADLPKIANGTTVTLDSAITTGSVWVGDFGATNGTLIITSTGSLTTDHAQFIVGVGSGVYALNIEGGALQSNYGINIGEYGAATLTMTGGSINAGAFWVGKSHDAYLNLDGGIMKSETVNALNLYAKGHINITGGKLVLVGNITDATTLGDVKAYGGLGTFVYDTVSNPGFTEISAVIPEPATMSLLGLGMILGMRRRKA